MCVGYDPLAFAVEEAHERGLQIEAWLNPYRISATQNFSAFDPRFFFVVLFACIHICIYKAGQDKIRIDWTRSDKDNT